MATGEQTTRLVIQLGDGATPTEAFAHTCGANTFGISLTNNFGETTMLDCASPLDVPAVVIRHLESQDTTVTISGKVTKTSWATWRAWADTATTKNIKIFFDETGANGGGHWIVSAVLTGVEINKEGSGTVDFTASIAGTGARAWTSAA
jgi:hypothetical protein